VSDEDLGEFLSIEVGRARKPIGERLMSEAGGSCVLRVGDVTRILAHYPGLHAPLTRLPWPLSRMQPHELSYTERAGGR
jgi:hypothetical protein